ncbi:MAG: PAS domain S-box protein [Ignavibacteriales bacterium]|nr:PAS domain S-box protein [Ignavibacteriales bacterium]
MKNIDKTKDELLQELNALKQENAVLKVRYEKDISEPKPEEDALRKSEQQIRTFLDSTSDMAFLKDESFRHIIVNSSLCKFYGKTENEIIGKTDFDLMPEEAALQCRKTDEQTLQLIALITSEEVIGDRYYETLKFPVEISKEKKGVGAYISDITERKRNEETLKIRNQNLASLNNIAIELASIQEGNDLYRIIVNNLKNLTGASLATFGLYDFHTREIHVKHTAFDKNIDEDLTKALGGEKLMEKSFPVDDEVRRVLIQDPVKFQSTLTDVTFGVVPSAIGKLIQKIEGFDRFVGIAYIVDDELYGTSVLSFKTDQTNPSLEILNLFANMVAVSLKRKLAEQARNESEEKFRSYIEHSPFGIYVTDDTGHYCDCNRVALELVGYTREELLNMSITDITPVEESEMHVKKLKEEGYIFIETFLIRKNKSKVPVLLEAVRLPNNMLMAYCTDITERKRAEELLRKSEEKYRSIFENIQDVYFEVSMDGTILEVSPSIEIMSRGGYHRNDFIGKSMHDFYAITSGGQTLLSLLKEQGSVIDNEIVFKNNDGSHIPCSISVKINLDSEGRPEKIIGSMHDITERKRAEESIIERENFLNTLLDAIPIPVFYKDKAGRYLGFNKAYETFFGTSRNEIIGKTVFEISPPELAEVYNAKDIELLENGVIQRYEFQIKTKHDLIRDVIFNKAVFTDNSGKVNGLIGTILDITERKQVEEKLRTSEAKFRAVAELSPMAIYSSSGSDRKAVYINDTFYKIFGFSMEDVPTVGQWWIKAFPDEKYRQKVIDQWVYNIEQANKNNRDVEALECVCTCKDGSEKIIVWVGKTIGEEFWAFGYDITERKQMEKWLMESEKEFRTLSESMPQIVWITTADGWNIYFNKQWVDYTGMTLEESYGNGWNKPFHPEDQQKAWDTWQNAIKNNDIYSIESRLRRADGVYNWFLIRGVPLMDEHGNILKWFGTCTDINEIKHTEEEIKKKATELERFNRLAAGREIKMIELKQKVNELSEQLGLAKPHALDFLTEIKNENSKNFNNKLPGEKIL